MVWRRIVVTGLLVLLSGCAQTPASDQAPMLAESGPAAIAYPMLMANAPIPAGGSVEWFNKDGVTAGHATLQADALEFPVRAGVTAIFAELRWSEGLQDLDLRMTAGPYQCPGQIPPPHLSGVSCVTDPYFCATGYAAFDACFGAPGAPDNPARLLLRGYAITDVLADCDDPCLFHAWPISREYASAGVTWELDVGVYYGPNPWDASETQTQVYGTHGSTDAYPYPTSSLAFQTLAAPTAVLGELTWTSTSGEADLDVGLYILQTDCANDSCHYGAESVTFVDAEGGTGAPDDPAYVLLRGESLQKVLEKCRDGGECQMWVGASSHDCPEDVVFGGQDCPSPSIQWRMAATVFHAEVPEGFTAFDVFPS